MHIFLLELLTLQGTELEFHVADVEIILTWELSHHQALYLLNTWCSTLQYPVNSSLFSHSNLNNNNTRQKKKYEGHLAIVQMR